MSWALFLSHGSALKIIANGFKNTVVACQLLCAVRQFSARAISPDRLDVHQRPFF
jgi:hypothetical protein